MLIQLPETIVKYLAKLSFDIDGAVDKADIIGAIFGQTEGLFGPEMNLNELQKNWKVGRIEILIESQNGKASGSVTIPMSTDISTVSLIAAAVEQIDKVGPCGSKFKLLSIDDVRAVKRNAIVERAKEISRNWASKSSSEGEDMLKDISESTIQKGKVLAFGKDECPAGPAINTPSDISVATFLWVAAFSNMLASIAGATTIGAFVASTEVRRGLSLKPFASFFVFTLLPCG